MNYLDLFSGIGGFTLGLQKAGFNFNWLGHSETNKYANQIYEKHYPESEPLGNVKAINSDRLPDLDLVTFGFPCQDLSIAGKRGGLQAKRSGLFFEAMRIIRIARPHHFIFENVKGLFSSNGGQDWLIVLKEVADSGYDGQWQLLNTRWFLPQNRERIYFVGHLRGERRPEVFPIRENGQKSFRKNPYIATCLEANYFKGASRKHQGKARQMIQVAVLDGKKDMPGSRIYSATGIATTISSNEKGSWNNTGLYMIQRSHGFNKGGVKELPCVRGSSMEQNDFVAEALQTDNHFVENRKITERTGKYGNGYSKQSFCLDSSSGFDLILHPNIRRLTPIECERLQGFPDNWTEGLSDTQRYKCLGNACTVAVVQVIGERFRQENIF